MDDAGEYVSVGAAAEASGRSPRTVLRWIRSEKVRSRPSETDRRVRLVRLSDVLAAAGSGAVGGDRALVTGELSIQPPPIRDDDRSQSVRDHALHAAYSQYRQLAAELGMEPEERTTEELRCTPLASKLRHAFEVARGRRGDHPERIARLLEGVVGALFWSPGADRPIVPREFWGTPLGRELARARVGTFDPADLLTVQEAAARLRLSTGRIYRWLDDGELAYVRDPDAGHTFVLREDVDARLEALEQAKQEVLEQERERARVMLETYEKTMERLRSALNEATQQQTSPSEIERLRSRLAGGEQHIEEMKKAFAEADAALAAAKHGQVPHVSRVEPVMVEASPNSSER